LHFFEVGVAVERGVAAEEEVSYYADGPDVAGEVLLVQKEDVRGPSFHVHWLAMASLFKDFGRHVARRAAGSRQDMELLLVHYS